MCPPDCQQAVHLEALARRLRLRALVLMLLLALLWVKGARFQHAVLAC